ncbi:MAG: 8-oxo-dGTP diphosphatase [Candidatus Micrarchaeaceae archaeon]
MMFRATLCHIIDGNRLLLKEATRGVSKGKWNGPGGKFEKGETPEQCAIRETFEETGIRMINPFFHGKLYFFMNGERKLSIEGFLFSARKFRGRIKSTEEGPVRWFSINKLPRDRMWEDDKYWLDLMLESRKFDAYFWYDRHNKKIIEYRIKMK